MKNTAETNLRITKFREAFVKLGEILRAATPDHIREVRTEDLREYIPVIDELALRVSENNPWFTPENVRYALECTGKSLEPEKLDRWLKPYMAWMPHNGGEPKLIGVVMSGNIPAVGFHDFMSVLLSGHRFLGKASSKDEIILPGLADVLISLEPGLKDYISFTTGRLTGFDAVIATGSDNSARYFRYYFARYPYIIRHNRTSVAFLTGDESEHDLKMLGRDVFLYFGLGCRSVSKLFLPEKMNPDRIASAWDEYAYLIDHEKYRNNYDYRKSIMMVNRIEFTDTGFVLLQQEEGIASPVAVVYYEFYHDRGHLASMLDLHKDHIQCIVGDRNLIETAVPFGHAQQPELWDYADNVDTIEFLLKLYDDKS